MTVKKTARMDPPVDPSAGRHYFNGETGLLHCHCYTGLYTRLVEASAMLEGETILADCSEDTFFGLLTDCFEKQGVITVEERIATGEQLFAAVGLGRMKVVEARVSSGLVRLDDSPVDEGWIRTWGRRDAPVNHIGCGYVAALFAATFDRSPRTYRARETMSIVSGAPHSLLVVEPISRLASLRRAPAASA